jgi:hypothetical protein
MNAAFRVRTGNGSAPSSIRAAAAALCVVNEYPKELVPNHLMS